MTKSARSEHREACNHDSVTDAQRHAWANRPASTLTPIERDMLGLTEHHNSLIEDLAILAAVSVIVVAAGVLVAAYLYWRNP